MLLLPSFLVHVDEIRPPHPRVFVLIFVLQGISPLPFAPESGLGEGALPSSPECRMGPWEHG